MALELPEDFVPRPEEFNALKARLLDPEGDSIIGITAALRGGGGYGKTTLTKALARDPDIQDAYFDGILWAELGQRPERLIVLLSDFVESLSGERHQRTMGGSRQTSHVHGSTHPARHRRGPNRRPLAFAG
jgi:hypothetical protein